MIGTPEHGTPKVCPKNKFAYKNLLTQIYTLFFVLFLISGHKEKERFLARTAKGSDFIFFNCVVRHYFVRSVEIILPSSDFYDCSKCGRKNMHERCDWPRILPMIKFYDIYDHLYTVHALKCHYPRDTLDSS